MIRYILKNSKKHNVSRETLCNLKLYLKIIILKWNACKRYSALSLAARKRLQTQGL